MYGCYYFGESAFLFVLKKKIFPSFHHSFHCTFQSTSAHFFRLDVLREISISLYCQKKNPPGSRKIRGSCPFYKRNGTTHLPFPSLPSPSLPFRSSPPLFPPTPFFFQKHINPATNPHAKPSPPTTRLQYYATGH